MYSNKEEQNTKKMNTKMKKKTTTLKEDIKGVYIIKCLFLNERKSMTYREHMQQKSTDRVMYTGQKMIE